MPKSQGREWHTIQDACLELSIALWSRLRPLFLAVLSLLRELDAAVSGLLWRLFCVYAPELTEHEARQILRMTQKKGKGREIHAPSPSKHPLDHAE